ncbi:Os08g0246001 [Oryza sativa Japonica Group]|uniref:Os08g0246001 protein n=1 Tax=Oryza sativa subsp. japonica TaxID=39947 RepID=A0A0P0XDN0_ORYSJ|nr:hypothetical protein EE612_043069 [Oryza sativa]BAT04526.1 Os08g0246001 [Oryza sativa Japonica Group]
MILGHKPFNLDGNPTDHPPHQISPHLGFARRTCEIMMGTPTHHSSCFPRLPRSVFPIRFLIRAMVLGDPWSRVTRGEKNM